AALGLALPLLRPERASPRPATPGADRLAEIDRQAARGEIGPDEAANLKLEAQRRLLAEARSAEGRVRPLSERGRRVVAAGLILAVLGGGTGLYLMLGRPDMAGRETLAAAPDQGLEAMTAALEAQVRQTPED